MESVKETVPEQIAGALEEMIRTRAWRVGERISSIRETAKSFRVSPTTAAEAYRLLVDRGLLRAKPRSGYYVCRVGPSAPMLTRAQALPLEPRQVKPLSMIQRMSEVRARKDMVELGSALPALELLPHREFARATRRALSRSSQRFLSLEPTEGTPELRRELARHLLSFGLVTSPEELFITVGATEAMHLVLGAVCRPGDVVALGSPNYYGFFQALEAMGLRALELPEDPEAGMDPEVLREALDRGVEVRAVLVCPSVSNPLGATMSSARQRALVSLCAERDIVIIEDSTYTDLRFDAVDRRVLHVPPDVQIVRMGSLSKTLAPGFRVGWCLPGVYRDRVRAYKVTTTFASPAPTNLIITEILRDHGYDRHLASLRDTLQRLIRETRGRIAEVLGPHVRVSDPGGGHVLWVELEGIDTAILFERCVARGVSFAPGALFSNTNAFSSCLRINAALTWNEQEQRALEIIGEECATLLSEQTCDM